MNGAITYDPTIPVRYNTLILIQGGFGYWIKVSADDTLKATGSKILPATPLALKSGWNLIGYFPDGQDSVAHALNDLGDNLIFLKGFDPEGKVHGQKVNGAITYDPTIPVRYNTLIYMQNSFGYWVKITSDDEVIYPGSAPASTKLIYPTPRFQEDVDLAMTPDWVDFYGMVEIDGQLANSGLSVRVYDSDGVLCGGCEVMEDGAFGILPVYGDDAITPEDEGASPGDRLQFYVDDRLADVEGESDVWLSDMGVRNVRLVVRPSTGDVPEMYALFQNSPNPFNPETDIRYQIPQAQKVKLEVYNTTGQVLRVLVDEYVGAGSYMVRWDGRDMHGMEVSSGMYFYRIEAGDFMSTKKMVMIK